MIPDITLIGGGVISLMTAREFVLAGARVTILEKNTVGRESSWAGGGILFPLYPWRQPEAISALVAQSLKIYPHLANDLLNGTGLDPEWYPCGMLITRNPDWPAAVDWCQRYRISCNPADPEFFKQLQTHPEHPLWLPEIAQARNPRLVKSLKQDLLNRGVIIEEHTEITGVVREGRQITAVLTTQGQKPVAQLVIAAGAWTTQLFAQLFAGAINQLPQIRPVKGQMVLFDAAPELLPFMVLDDDRYLIPRRDGKILAGSTVEYQEFDKTPTAGAENLLKDFARNLLPALQSVPVISHWAGLRPGTDQGIPYIDRHPELSNVAINAGHFRNGLAMGPASAQLLVDLVLNRPPAIAAQPYALFSPH